MVFGFPLEPYSKYNGAKIWINYWSFLDNRTKYLYDHQTELKLFLLLDPKKRRKPTVLD